jgi:hypothetical protein
LNCTPATATLSEAEAVTETGPETVEPAVGAVRLTAGGMDSAGPVALKAMTLPIQVALLPVAVAAPVTGLASALLHIAAKLWRRTWSAASPAICSPVVLFALYSPYAPNTTSSVPVVVTVPELRVPVVAVARFEPSNAAVAPGWPYS